MKETGARWGGRPSHHNASLTLQKDKGVEQEEP